MPAFPGRRSRVRAFELASALRVVALGGSGVLILGLQLAVTSTASAAKAKATPAQTCQVTQLSAASKFMQGEFQCWSAFSKNPSADPTGSRLLGCLAKSDNAFASAYRASLATAGAGVCGMETPIDSLLPRLQGDVDGLVFAIAGDGPGTDRTLGGLFASLESAAGTALSGALGAESKDAKAADEARRQAARSGVRSKLLSTFAKVLSSAASKGVAYTGLPAAGVADEVDRIANELAAFTSPPGETSFSLSGSIRVADGSVIDSDVNDPNTTPISNDLPATAQEVAVPAVVGGYVNLPGAGPAGNSRSAGDVADFFRVSLNEGQLVNLHFGDPLAADLDLCLYSVADPTTPIDCSLGVGDTEELSAPSSGSFYLEVFPDAGCACGSTYVLTLGQPLPAAGPTGVRLSDEFESGELVVTLASSALAPAGKAASASSLEASSGMRAVAGAPDREMLFQLPDDAAARARTLQSLAPASAGAALPGRFAGLSGAQREKLDTVMASKALARRADVALAEPNFIRHALVTPNDPLYPLQWHYPLINLPAAWDLTTGSTNVKVAVIDTGVLHGHPDLQGQLAPGFDFISNSAAALDGNGIDPDPEDPGDGGGVGPSSFHGTHVAGTIGAKTQNAYGVAGVAWNVTLVPLRVLGFGGGTDFDILQAVRYAAGLPNNSGTSNKVDVINLSLGGTGYSQTAQNVFAQARSAGVIVVAAAGNNNSSQLFYPASYDGVVSVSAVDLLKQKAGYSNFGTAVDVAAPGGDIATDRNGDGYADGVLSTLKDELSGAFNFRFYNGTSMAAPHVTGVVALMKSVKPSLTPAEFDTLLASGSLTTDLGAAGRDDIFGNGLIDARKAVEAASASPPSGDPILLVSPTGLNLGTAGTQAAFQATNGGGGTLSVTAVTDDQPWLSVAAAAVDGNGVGSYQATISRAGLAPGTYTGTIDVQSSAGNSSVSVVMAVVTAATSANAGFHYVLLMDPDTLASVAQFDVAADAGQYSFVFTHVQAGRYLLVAGTDSDNDFLICGTGEACGAFPTLGSMEVLEVTSDRSGLDFVTGFLQTLNGTAADGGADPRSGAFRRLHGKQLSP